VLTETCPAPRPPRRRLRARRLTRQGRIELRGGTWSDAIVEKTQRNTIVNRDLALSVVFFSRSNKVLRGWGEHHRVAKTLLVIVAMLREFIRRTPNSRMSALRGEADLA
jgi:hypothetical protein